MTRAIIALAVVLLVGCATQPGPSRSEAIDDFVQVSELEERDSIRSHGQYSYTYLSEDYVILNTRRGKFLVQFIRACRELNETRVTPDIRHQRDVLRSRFDTLRGCRIAHLFALDEAQAQELKDIGKAPGEKT